ncbi:MAG TPA: PorP/SprF family type IX secretion system membrane protein [Flavisolibacter sp.]
MRYFLSLLILLSGVVVVNAQQLTTSSMFDMYGVLHNPATAGSAQHGVIGGNYRKLWDAMPGGPETALLFGSGYLKKSRLGIGGYVYTDKTGPTSYKGLELAIAYHIPLKNNTTFSLGLEGRAQQFSFDRAKLAASLNTGGTVDPVIAGDENRFKGDAGFGVAINNQKFQFGASVSQLIQSKLNLYEGTGTPNEEGRLYRHYYLHGNYRWKVDEATNIVPNLLMIYLPNAPLELQGGARVEHHNLFWWGVTWRSNQAWLISAGLKIKQRFNIGYSFDLYNTPLSVYDGGSQGHEIMLRYDFMK